MLIEFQDCPKDTCFIDLRTPGEYADGTIGKAINIPIFTNEERHTIGTIYKQESIEQAKSLAIQAASDKLPDMYREIIQWIEQKGSVVLFCARGGMRSQTLGSLLSAMGYPVQVIRGGYKAYRQAVVEGTEQLNKEMNYVVLHGHTGTGKTEILKYLHDMGHAVLDIEGLARHRGSLLGKIGIEEQITQKQFEHEVYEVLRNIGSGFVFVEAESRRLGSLLVPQCIMDRMRISDLHVMIEADLEFRAEQIVKDYMCHPGAALEIRDTLDRFVKYIGHERVKALKEQLDLEQYHEVAKELMVNYYDPKYAHRQYPYIRTFKVKETLETAKELEYWMTKDVIGHILTRIVDGSDVETMEELGALMREGKLVVFPTETVYGLGGNAFDPKAAAKIYAAKGRPSDNPLIVHIHEIAQLEELVESVSPLSQQLMDTFWPGPLTLIFKKSDRVPYGVTGGLETVAVRMPDHPVALSFLKASGVPVAAPSANVSGRPSPTKCSHVMADLYGRVDAILCGDQTRIGLESTVVDATGTQIVVLRPGGITKEMMLSVTQNISVDLALDEVSKPKAPGMKYTHYAPDAPLHVFLGDENNVIDAIKKEVMASREKGLKVGILTVAEHVELFESLPGASEVINLGRREHPEELANAVFDSLRQFNALGVDVIFAEGCEDKDIGSAVMNRLKKAAGGRIIEV